MVKAWFMDSSDEDQRLPHQLDPPQPVSLEDLENCGVLYWQVSSSNHGTEWFTYDIKTDCTMCMISVAIIWALEHSNC